MRAPRSLRARLTLAALLAVAIGGTIAGGLLLAAVARDGRRAVDAELRQQVAEVLRGGPGDRPSRGGRRGSDRLLAGSGTFVQLAFGGEVVAQRGDVPVDAPPPPREDGLATVDIDGRAWRSLTVSFAGSPGQRLQVLSTLAPVEARVASIRRLILLVGLLALALTGLAAWAFTSLAVRPLARLQEGAARVSGAEDLRSPLPDEGPDEVRSLAGALNGMLARLQASTTALQRALEATRRFAADAGHELRTPLTSLRANLDTLERNPDLPAAQRAALLSESSAEQDRIVHLLDGLQALARGEAAEALPREDVELGDLVDAAVYAARRRHPQVTYELREQAAEGSLHGWAGGLRLLVDNLLDNAALHGRDGGGRVEVDLAREGGGWLLRVADDGPGIPAADRERVLEPFARGQATAAPGTGLGLAIVAQQVALHGGELRLGDSRLGGLTVEVRLPR
jgi:two-component system, OmpR family, sensor histidine kinase PrrB